MSARDPKWIGLALKAYDACLPLYPREVREAHGEEMRQAFRDRCREVARGQRGAWQWFGEMAPDLIGSAARAHADVGGKADGRVLPGLSLLVLLAAALATQSRWSIATTDAMKSAGRALDVARATREWNHERAFVAETTASLLAQGDQESLAVAALLQRGQFDQRWLDPVLWQNDGPMRAHLPDAGAKATSLAAPIFTGQPSLGALAISAQACSVGAGCNEDSAIRRWLARDPDNAYPWMMSFKRASRRGDEAGMQHALAGVAKARYAQSHMAMVQRVLLARVTADAPGDREAFADAAAQFRGMQGVLTDDLPNDMVVRCSLLPRLYGKARWIDEHPEAQPACMHLAGLLAASSDAWASMYGWRQLKRSGIEMTPARVQAWRDAGWLYSNVAWRVGGESTTAGQPAQPWTLEQWQRWNAAWAPGDGEVPALRRWLRANSLPEHAPADYDAGS
jgi:hypothetical protein